MKPPLIVESSSEILFFKSIENAEAYIEPIDVRDGVYKNIYDTEGKRLKLKVIKETGTSLFGLYKYTIEKIVIEYDGNTNNYSSELRKTIIQYLSKIDVGVPENDIYKKSLGHLIAAALDCSGYS